MKKIYSLSGIVLMAIIFSGCHAHHQGGYNYYDDGHYSTPTTDVRVLVNQSQIRTNRHNHSGYSGYENYKPTREVIETGYAIPSSEVLVMQPRTKILMSQPQNRVLINPQQTKVLRQNYYGHAYY
jgi:hypothetical protein